MGIGSEAGQPIKMKSGRRGSNFSFYMDVELDQAIDQIRWREHVSKSEIVRRAVEEYVKNHSAGNSTFTLDNWNDEPNFKVMPSLSAKLNKWDEYLDSCERKDLVNIMIWSNKIWKKAKSAKERWRRI
ncbi:MAG: ribbon-helix-helix domain-containing protein [Nitrososphaeraceae archaeon]